MISVEDALGRIVGSLHPTPAETVGLPDALGRVLAAPVHARLTQPPADVSAMDGYALRAADGAAGRTLRIVGEAPAGHPFAGGVGVGEAVRLFTGSVVPDGADTILLQEDAERQEGHVLVKETAQAGRHIRRKGQDFAAGDALLQPGQWLGARSIGLAAAANHPWLHVHRRPRIAILATGDEIAMPGEPIGPGGIVSSNSHALAAMVRQAGGEAVVLPVARDERGAIAAAAESARRCDMLVTTGGASVGDHDLVQAGLAELGFQLEFWRIAMRPGKPLIFGRFGDVPVLGLPGNPVSALVCATLFLLPALARLSGQAGTPLPRVPAITTTPLRANDRRADYLRATLRTGPGGELLATAFEVQDSGMLRVLAAADALLLRAPHAPALPAGAPVEVLRLDTAGL